MSGLREDLDATADSVVKDAERLISVERQKKDATGSARAEALGDEALRIAAELSRKVRAEAEITDRLAQREH